MESKIEEGSKAEPLAFLCSKNCFKLGLAVRTEVSSVKDIVPDLSKSMVEKIFFSSSRLSTLEPELKTEPRFGGIFV